MPHEGVDLARWRDGTGQVRRLSSGLWVAAPCAGRLVHVHEDFLGKTLYLRTGLQQDRADLHLVLGHVRPVHGLVLGDELAAGRAVGCVGHKESSPVLPHLHLTLAWIKREIGPVDLNWARLAAGDGLRLLDPARGEGAELLTRLLAIEGPVNPELSCV